jgi:hypothetical protein
MKKSGLKYQSLYWAITFNLIVNWHLYGQINRYQYQYHSPQAIGNLHNVYAGRLIESYPQYLSWDSDDSLALAFDALIYNDGLATTIDWQAISEIADFQELASRYQLYSVLGLDTAAVYILEKVFDCSNDRLNFHELQSYFSLLKQHLDQDVSINPNSKALIATVLAIASNSAAFWHEKSALITGGQDIKTDSILPKKKFPWKKFWRADGFGALKGLIFFGLGYAGSEFIAPNKIKYPVDIIIGASLFAVVTTYESVSFVVKYKRGKIKPDPKQLDDELLLTPKL